MATNLSRKTLSWTIAGVAVAVAGIAVAIILAAMSSGDDSTRSQDQAGEGNQQAGDNGIVAGGDVTIQAEQFTDEVRDLSREEAEQVAQQYRDVLPPESGPAPFLIIDAPRNLFVRSDGTVDGFRIGAVYNRAIVWADCFTATDFDPDLTDGADATWLRIHWHTDEPNEGMAGSQPSGQYHGWVYAGLTLPAGHNGQLPECGSV